MEFRKMKKYLNPEIEIVELSAEDIITTSPGTETTPKDENDGIWDLNI
jgi:hypothetical protein